MHGMSALPAKPVAALNDRVCGATMGPLKLTPPVDESISGLAESDKGASGETRTWMERRSQFGREMRFVGALLRRSVELGDNPALSFDASVDPGRAWHLVVFVNNDKVLDRLIDGKTLEPANATGRSWAHVQVDLGAYKKQAVVIRLYDLVLVPNHEVGNSYWRNVNSGRLHSCIEFANCAGGLPRSWRVRRRSAILIAKASPSP